MESLPPELFRIIFESLDLTELISLDKAFALNHRLAALLQLCFQRFPVNDFLSYPHHLPKLHWVERKQITIANISMYDFNPPGLAILSYHQATLQSLMLSGDSRPAFGHLLQSDRVPLLTSLSLENCNRLPWDSLHKFLARHPRLERLALSSCDSSSQPVNPLLLVTKHCPHLTHLTLRYNSWVSDTLVALLPLGSTLRSIDLSFTNVQEQATIVHLMDSCPHLCYLFFTLDDHFVATFHLVFQRIIQRQILAVEDAPALWSESGASLAMSCLGDFLGILSTSSDLTHRELSPVKKVIRSSPVLPTVVRLLVSRSCGGGIADRALKLLVALSTLGNKLCHAILALNLLPLLLEFHSSLPSTLFASCAALSRLLALAPAPQLSQLLRASEDQLLQSPSPVMLNNIFQILSALVSQPSATVLEALRSVDIFGRPLLQLLHSPPSLSAALECLNILETAIHSTSTRGLVDPGLVSRALKSLLERDPEWFGAISRSLSDLLLLPSERDAVRVVIDSGIIAQALSLGSHPRTVLGIAHLTRRAVRQLDRQLLDHLILCGVVPFLVSGLARFPSLRDWEARDVLKTLRLLLETDKSCATMLREMDLPPDARAALEGGSSKERKRRRAKE
jgi:hypothetical protein